MLMIRFLAAAIFVLASATASLAADAQSANGFRDCPDCPEMVRLPAGAFQMGAAPGQAPPSARQSPQHRVEVRSFAAGKYDVTREEYEAFVEATSRPDPDVCQIVDPSATRREVPGFSWRNPGFAQGARDPAVCVSWEDAVAYSAWLSQRTGKHYRLLSESEWEYAARAGTAGQRYGSDMPADLCAYINHGDRDYNARFPSDDDVNKACSDGYVFTSPVGSFRPNGFGLYDMLGNVWQWTADCDNPNYEGAPADGSPWLSGNCDVRVGRGGSWSDDAFGVRAQVRGQGDSRNHGSTIGFRIARDL